MATHTDTQIHEAHAVAPVVGDDLVAPRLTSRHPHRLRWLLVGAAWLVLAAAVSLMVQLLAARLPVPPGSNVPRALATWVSVAALTLLAVLFLTSRLTLWVRDASSVVLLSGLATSTVALPLHGTYYYLGG